MEVGMEDFLKNLKNQDARKVAEELALIFGVGVLALKGFRILKSLLAGGGEGEEVEEET